MKHALSRQREQKVDGNDLLKAIQQSVATVGHGAAPAIFAHVQPHAHATSKLVRYFAAACGFDNGIRGPTLNEVEFGAQMHDIGKYFIAPSVLLKPGLLDEEERAIVSLHSIYGSTIISALPGMTDAIRHAVLYHHERWDGSGYPEGLSGTNIPLEARVVSVVDVYTSLRAMRSYKPPMTKAKACQTLRAMAGRELDPSLVEDFIRMVGPPDPQP
jgi:HD-GYP domain-containing protein (c-di-GMP phosphodiesterase class II)